MVALLPVQDPERAIERADNSGRKRMRIKANEWRRDLKRVQEEGDGGRGMSSGGGGRDADVGGSGDGATGIGGNRGMSSGLAVFRRRIERASRLAAFEGTSSTPSPLCTPSTLSTISIPSITSNLYIPIPRIFNILFSLILFYFKY